MSVFQGVVPSLTEVLQGLMMNPVLGVVCPEMQESVLQVFTDIDPSSSNVSEYSQTCVKPIAIKLEEIGCCREVM